MDPDAAAPSSFLLTSADAARGAALYAVPAGAATSDPAGTADTANAAELEDAAPDSSRIGSSSGPRERALAEGVWSLGDADLLAIVLGTGLAGRPVTLVAASLLARFSGIEGIARLGPHALAAQPGLGLIKALRVAAALELGRRAHERSLRPRPPVSTSRQIAMWCAAHLGPLDHEQMWVISLDGRNGMRGARRVAEGGLHGCSVAARDVLRAALADAASALILVHNHPSGDPSPSPEDILMTQVLVEAGLLVGVPLIDHIILAPDGQYASLLDIGVISRPARTGAARERC